MNAIDELLIRGVDTIYPSKEALEKVLRSGKKLKLYQGFDPTGTQLHIGHMVGLRKLRQWQDLGHHVIFLIGDGTGEAGDPSGKTKARNKFFKTEELRQNAKDYISQASKIVRFEGENPIEIRYNGDWLNKLTKPEILDLLGYFSLQQLEERDLFVERKKHGQTISMREFIYPVLQAYDSVAMEVDLEIGGSDQTFNMLCGRMLVKAMLNREKFVITTPLLTDSKGVKIGKSEGNIIALTDIPEDLFGKIMALPDDVIARGFEYLTNVSMNEIKEISQTLQRGENPMICKKKLAFEIVKQLNSEIDAKEAQTSFEKIVQKGEAPISMPTISWPQSFISTGTVAQGTISADLASSNSEAKRIIEQGGLRINNQVIKDPNAPLANYIKGDEKDTIQRGPREIRKIRTKP